VDSKERAQQLMYALMPYAEKMLGETGGFFPYAGVMGPDEQVHVVQFAEETQVADPKEVFEFARQALRQGAQEGKWTSTALVADVDVAKPADEGADESAEGEKVQAVSFALDDNEGTSVQVFFPYIVNEGRVEFGTAFAERGAGEVFGETAKRAADHNDTNG
jgi:hypothetical protein